VHSLTAHLQEALGNGWTVTFTALRVAAVFVVLLLFIRLSGKRVLGHFSPFDLVTMLLISNAVQNAMVGPDNSLSGGLIAAGILLLLNRLVSRHSWLREALEGEPVVLVQNGKVFSEPLQREGISLHELEAALRAHGVARLDEVATAVLEVDGTISVSQIGERSLKRLQRVRSSRNR
jgi:uncharacterized membrane protein YcaP (DUF421 family)